MLGIIDLAVRLAALRDIMHVIYSPLKRRMLAYILHVRRVLLGTFIRTRPRTRLLPDFKDLQ